MKPKEAALLNSKVPELMGATEVAAEFGVAQQNLRKVANLPEPAQTLARGAVWRADVVRAAAADRRRRLERKLDAVPVPASEVPAA